MSFISKESFVHDDGTGGSGGDGGDGLPMTYEYVLDSPFNVPLASGHIRGHTPASPGGQYGTLYAAKDAGGPVDQLFSALVVGDVVRLTSTADAGLSQDYRLTTDVSTSVPDGTAWSCYSGSENLQGGGVPDGSASLVTKL